MNRRVIAPGRSCLECRRRKIRCDRSSPCRYCVRINVDCRYPSAEAPSGITKQGTGSDVGARVERLEDAFQRLIQELPQLRPAFQDLLQLNDEPDTRLVQTPEMAASSASQIMPLATTLPLADDSILTATSSSMIPVLSIAELYPSPAAISVHWQTFLDSIDPLIKILHTPTTQRQVMAVIQGRRSELDGAAECLMFSIFYSTVVVMSASSCEDEYHCSKDLLLKRYRTGVEYALLENDYTASQNLTILQSMVLYLTCSRLDTHGPDTHKLLKVILDRAIAMGLHSLGDDSFFSSFDGQMRCRLWWQIRSLDVQHAVDHDADPSIIDSANSTPLPANINDSALNPNMRSVPDYSECKTEMIFTLVQFRITELIRQVHFSSQFCHANGYPLLTEDGKAQKIDLVRRDLEKKYLAHCDMCVPLDYATSNYVRIRFPELKLWVYKTASQANKTSHIRINYQKICIDALAWSQTLNQYSPCRQYLWFYQTRIEWDALWHLLNDLCQSPYGVTARAGWRTAKEAFERWDADAEFSKDHLWEKIVREHTRAMSLREGRTGQV